MKALSSCFHPSWTLRTVFEPPTLERPSSLNCYLPALSSPNTFCHQSLSLLPPPVLVLSLLFALFPSAHTSFVFLSFLSSSNPTCHHCSSLSSIYMCSFLLCPSLFTSSSHSLVCSSLLTSPAHYFSLCQIRMFFLFSAVMLLPPPPPTFPTHPMAFSQFGASLLLQMLMMLVCAVMGG